MVDRRLLRLSAIVLIVFAVVSSVSTGLHPNREVANNHAAVFMEYAQSTDWTAVHLLQFVAVALLVAGLLALVFALNMPDGMPGVTGLFGVLAAGVTLAMAAVQYAVDGVALKQAVDAWASAPAAEQAARFASAEAVRWLEWGMASYANFMIGLTLLLLGIAIAVSARISKAIGYLMALSGVGFLLKGWVVGTEGFAPGGALPSTAAQALVGVWIIWLAIVAWRTKENA